MGTGPLLRGPRGPLSMILVLMVDAPGSSAMPPRGELSTFFSVDGERSWISGTASQKAHHRWFLALMVGAPGSPAPTPPKGPTVNDS
jgi:hypothetical protein